MGSTSDCWAEGQWFKSQHLTSAETHMWGRWLAVMLALYTSKGVAPKVNLREHISHVPPPSANKAEPTLALISRGDVTRSPKQGYQWPHKWIWVQQNFKKNLKKNHMPWWRYLHRFGVSFGIGKSPYFVNETNVLLQVFILVFRFSSA